MHAEDVMSLDVLALQPSDTLADAARRMVDRGVAGAPVLDREGNLAGILSEADILEELKETAEAEIPGRYLANQAHSLFLFVRLAKEGRPDVQRILERLRTRMVKEAMTADVITAAPSDTLEYIAALMIRHNINRIPILRDDRLVGIVTRHDIVRMIGAE